MCIRLLLQRQGKSRQIQIKLKSHEYSIHTLCVSSTLTTNSTNFNDIYHFEHRHSRHLSLCACMDVCRQSSVLNFFSSFLFAQYSASTHERNAREQNKTPLPKRNCPYRNKKVVK